MTHDDFRNAWFVDASGRKVFVRVVLEPEKLRVEASNHRLEVVSLPLFDDYDHSTYLRRWAALYDLCWEMADALLSSPSASPKLRIAVVERDEQLWCGIPYGQRTCSDRWPLYSTISPWTSRKRPPTGFGWQNKQRWLAFFQAEAQCGCGLRWISRQPLKRRTKTNQDSLRLLSR